MLKNITIIISDVNHPINTWIETWVNERPEGQSVKIVRSADEAKGGDICFLVSCTEILAPEFIDRYSHVLVIHASDLPKGRGWSPHVWQIINGAAEIVVTLLEASERVDCGDIWSKSVHNIPEYFLYQDIINVVNKAHLDLMDFAVKNYGIVTPHRQASDIDPTYFRKRTPGDSEINAFDSIAAQFNLLRVCDENRFPSFFYLHGKKFKITIESCDD
jgi:methionyl-tRNA formyltransferase